MDISFSKSAISKSLLSMVLPLALFSHSVLSAPRLMENLGRGVVAFRANDTNILISWRLLGLDPDNIGFNIYRATDGGTGIKLNDTIITDRTNFLDTTADTTKSNVYYVKPVIDELEQEESRAFTLSENHAVEPIVRVPIKEGNPIKYVWVGDLDGDGEYDYVIDRQGKPQGIEAYRSNGEFLWQVNMGPNSIDQSSMEGGSSAINLGSVDGMTVYDFDSDGKAEVAVRIANGVVFGDGKTYDSLPDDMHQAVAILDGMTGALRSSAPVSGDFFSDGTMYARFGVGYLDGVNPSLVTYMKNRREDLDFNLVMNAWKFDGNTLTQQWKWLRETEGQAPDGHNTRIIDVDGDGKDEIAEIGFVLNGDGTLRYSLGEKGIIHGDRFHIAKMDPSRPNLQGYGVQQNNPSGLLEYYYDAADGTILWEHFGNVEDVGRGMVGDIDPNAPGMEAWSFYGLYNAPSNELLHADTTLRPWPQLGIWWDGDLLLELLNGGVVQKWNPERPSVTGRVPRILRTNVYGGVNPLSTSVNPLFLGDILGDWREEMIYTNADFNELLIFTTNIASNTRLYTLPHNPAYRNAMTLKGYMQSNHVDYFLGHDMSTPPRPNITYVNAP